MPPASTAAASAVNNRVRCSGGNCMNCADTRSNESRSGGWAIRSACRHSMRAAAAGSVSRACCAARSSATPEISAPTTIHPARASQMASAPSPQPTSRARPGGRPATSATSCGFGFPLQTRCADRYRSSQKSTPNIASGAWACSLICPVSPHGLPRVAPHCGQSYGARCGQSYGAFCGVHVVDASSWALQTEEMTARRIVFLIFDGLQPIDLVGPHEVFSYAGRLSHDGEYRCQVAARAAGPVRTPSGLLIHAEHSVFDLGPAGIDTIVVVGGAGVDAACRDGVLVEWLAAAGRTARRVASVCTGVFLLAAAGLAEGRRVTCHWSRAGQLAAGHPGLTVDANPIFIRDGRIWTSAGVTAGMDLALALVEEDLGAQVARDVARYLVLYLRRPGSQSQFSVPLWSAQPSTDPIRAAVSAVHADPGARLGITDLAAHARLSPRHLQRRFAAEIGTPPASYVEQVRIESARRALTEGDDPVDAIARRCGFGTAETLRRVFQRRLGVAPSEYRDRFRLIPLRETP